MAYTLGIIPLSFTIVYKRVTVFKNGREIVEDYPGSRRPTISKTPEIIEKFQDMVIQDGRLQLSEFSKATSISNETIAYPNCDIKDENPFGKVDAGYNDNDDNVSKVSENEDL